MYFKDAPLDGDTLLSYISTLHSSDKTYVTLQNVKHKTTHSICFQTLSAAHFPSGHDYIIVDASLLIKPFKLEDVIINLQLTSPPAAGFDLMNYLNT